MSFLTDDFFKERHDRSTSPCGDVNNVEISSEDSGILPWELRMKGVMAGLAGLPSRERVVGYRRSQMPVSSRRNIHIVRSVAKGEG